MAAIWQRVLGVSLSPAGASLVILIVQPVSMPLQRASSSDVPIEHAGAIVDSLRVGGIIQNGDAIIMETSPYIIPDVADSSIRMTVCT